MSVLPLGPVFTVFVPYFKKLTNPEGLLWEKSWFTPHSGLLTQKRVSPENTVLGHEPVAPRPCGQPHPVSPSGSFFTENFLWSLEWINRSHQMRISRQMSMPAHLHCLLNTCLRLSSLMWQARGMRNIYVCNRVALIGAEDFARSAT